MQPKGPVIVAPLFEPERARLLALLAGRQDVADPALRAVAVTA